MKRKEERTCQHHTTAWIFLLLLNLTSRDLKLPDAVKSMDNKQLALLPEPGPPSDAAEELCKYRLFILVHVPLV